MGGQEYRDRIVSELGDMATSNGTQGASPGGSFAFTESDIRKVISNWLDIRDSYDRSITTVTYSMFIDAPGLDYASKSFTDRIFVSREALVQHLEGGREYSVQQAQLALNALNDYLGVEHTNVETFNAAPQAGPTVV